MPDPFRPGAISIGGRLKLINGSLVLAIALVGSIAWHALTYQEGTTGEVIRLSVAQHLQEDADMMHDGLRAHVYASLLVGEISGQSRAEITAAARADATRLLADLRGLAEVRLDGERDTRPTTRALAERYASTATQLVALAADEPRAARVQLADFEKEFQSVREAMDQQTGRIRARIQAARETSATAAREARQRILVSALLTCAVLGIVVTALSASIRRSLRFVGEAAGAIASGHFDRRTTLRTDDELGQLARSIDGMAASLEQMIERMRSQADRDAFGSQLVEALEMAVTETEAHAVVAHAMQLVSREHSMELLLADSSRAHLERAAAHPDAGAPGCTVESPFGCVAVRRGNPVAFDDSGALNACRHLRNRSSGATSAVCVPLSFMGRTLGVLHAAGPVPKPLTTEQVTALTTLGIQAAARIGTVRAFERTQIRAATDGLTGLANRRTLESSLRSLLNEGRPFSFVIGDLDHFKRLNDTYGHQVGDRALQLFAEVVRSCIREGDHAGRWGGEEFAFALPDTACAQALEWVERLRASLARAQETSTTARYTASFGIADSTMAETLEAIVRIADTALYRSKEQGRDRETIGCRADVDTVLPSHATERSSAVDLQLLVSEL